MLLYHVYHVYHVSLYVGVKLVPVYKLPLRASFRVDHMVQREQMSNHKGDTDAEDVLRPMRR